MLWIMKKQLSLMLTDEKVAFMFLKSCLLMFILLVVCLPSYGVHAYEFKESIGKDWTMNSTTELGRWFNETWIEKVGGTWDVKKKRYSVPGYINGWYVYRYIGLLSPFIQIFSLDLIHLINKELNCI